MSTPRPDHVEAVRQSLIAVGGRGREEAVLAMRQALEQAKISAKERSKLLGLLAGDVEATKVATHPDEEYTVDDIVDAPQAVRLNPLRTAGPALALVLEIDAPPRLVTFCLGSSEENALARRMRSLPLVQDWLDGHSWDAQEAFERALAEGLIVNDPRTKGNA